MTEPEREPKLWRERAETAEARVTELEATLPPPLTEAELAELTRSSEKLYSAEARVTELESSNGYPLAAEWRGKCEAARAKIAELEAQLADALKIVARMWPNQPNLRLALLHVEQMVRGMKGHIARTAPTSDKPEPPAQERKGDSHTSVRQELHDITSPGSESVTTAAGPKTERCPHCNCSSIHKEQDRDDEGNVTNEWAECLYCGEQWSWQDKQKTGIVALDHANIEAITFESDDGEWVVTVSYTDATSDTHFSFAKAIEILTRDKQKAAAGDTSEVSETREGSPSLDAGAEGNPAAAELPKRTACRSFSGDGSEKMWKLINHESMPALVSDALFEMGCVAQAVENRVEQLAAEVEKMRMASKTDTKPRH